MYEDPKELKVEYDERIITFIKAFALRLLEKKRDETERAKV